MWQKLSKIIKFTQTKITIIILAILIIVGLVSYFLFSSPRNQSPKDIPQIRIVDSLLFPSRNIASSTLHVPPMPPDTTLGSAGTRLILPARADMKEPFSYNAVSWVFVEKNNTIHAEYIYGTEFMDQSEKSDTPKLVSGGVIYTDKYGTVRKFLLTDLATIKNITDPATLNFVKGSDTYLSDTHSVYFLKSLSGIAFDPNIFLFQPIPHADPTTFVVISKLPRLDLAVDKNTVYLRGEAQVEMDRGTFRTLKEDYLYRDAHGVYVATGPSTPTGIDWTLEKHSFESLERKIDSDSIYYSTDGQTVFLNKNKLDVINNGQTLERTPIVGADPNTFVQLTGLLSSQNSRFGNKPQYVYARDAKNVYYKGIVIVGANVNEFQPLENDGFFHSYAVDASHVYYEEKLLPNADPNTFEILWSIPYEGCSTGEYSKDASHVYYKNKIVVGADPKTFRASVGEVIYGADDNNVYKEDQILPKTEPKTSVCNYE